MRNSLVVVSQRVDRIPDRNEVRDATDQKLATWLQAAGFLAVPISNAFAEPEVRSSWFSQIQPAGIVLSGGNDIGREVTRDDTEHWLLERAEHQGLPVLGICRGMQMMAVHAGGELKSLAGHVRTRHGAVLSTASDAVGWPTEVNSYHNLGLAECPAGYCTSVLAPDGQIEAIRHLRFPWEGWMWHPEREITANPVDIRRVRALFSE